MGRARREVALLGLVLLSLGCFGDDGPPANWPMPFGSPSHQSVGLSGPVEKPSLLWMSPFPWREPTSPVGDDRRIYVAGDRMVIALDAETGKLLWESPRYWEVTGGPTLVGERLLVTAGDWIDCLDSATGEQIWRGRLPWISFSDPTVHEDLVLVDCKNPARSDVSRLVALSLDEGKEQWFSDYMDSKHLTPAVMDDSAIITTGVGVHRISLNEGEKEWSHDFSSANEIGLPVVGEDRVYFWRGIAGKIRCLSLETGKELWSYRPKGDAWNPALAPGKLLFESLGEGFVALDSATGEKLWAVPRTGELESTPVIAGDLAYWQNGHAVVATHLQDGSIAWELEIPHSARGIALHQGRLLVNSRKHGLLCFR